MLTRFWHILLFSRKKFGFVIPHRLWHKEVVFFIFMNFWLMKSEPTCFSFDDLLTAPNKTAAWDGVRNYQARNFIRDGMKCGDKVIFFHSNCTPPHAIGVMQVVREAYLDSTAFDPESEHPDAKSTPKNPRWFVVDVQAERKFTRPVALAEMKNFVELADMQLLKIGNRLSVMPISEKHFELLCQLGGIGSSPKASHKK